MRRVCSVPAGLSCVETGLARRKPERSYRSNRRLRWKGDGMRRRLSMVLLLALLALAVPVTVLGDVTVGPGGGTPGTASNFTLVGHNDLFARGMNAAIASFDHYIYVGNRTDGSDTCGIGD